MIAKPAMSLVRTSKYLCGLWIVKVFEPAKEFPDVSNCIYSLPEA